MGKEKKISFTIIGIKELGYTYLDPIQNIKNIDLSNDTIEGKFNINYRWNLEKNLFAVIFDFAYLSVDKESKGTECLKLSVMTEFMVDNLKSVFTVRSNRDFDIDESLEITLVSLTISTARGILFEKSKGTLFSNFVLPLINPGEVVLSRKFRDEN